MKNIKFKSLQLSLLILLIFNVSCSKEDVLSDDILGGGRVTAIINGNIFESAKEYDKVEITTVSGIYIIALSAGDAEGVNKLKGLVLVASGLDFNSLNNGKTWNQVGNSGEIDRAAAAYSEDDGNGEENDFDTELTKEVYIKITSIDKNKKIISGEFSFTAVDEDTSKEYQATNGKFIEIPYILTEQ